MYTFFVLGQIPGTNITITFSMWAMAAAALLGVMVLAALVRRRHELASYFAPEEEDASTATAQ